MYKILDKKRLNNLVDRMTIEAPFISKNAKPGHFVILRVNNGGERVPLTIVDHSATTIDIIYQKLGYTTKLLSTLEVNDTVSDIVGPLGESIKLHKANRILAVAGGVGAAPLFPQIKAYHEIGVNCDLVLGAKSKNLLLLQDEFSKICSNIYLCTDDGSAGIKGYVTDKVSELLRSESYDHAIAIGPLIMMKHVVQLSKENNLPIDVSLNPIMIDGTGMCGNCRVSIGGKTFFACVDGPDFPGEHVDFDELLTRQDYYKDQEHICNLEMKINEYNK